MAEYIDREKLINDGIAKGFCDWYDEIKRAQKANVVEREKYDELKSDYKLSVEAHKQSIRLYNNKIKELEDLNSKIDKAIAEIKDGYYGNEEKSETDSERADAFNNGLSYALEILKRNIGE